MRKNWFPFLSLLGLIVVSIFYFFESRGLFGNGILLIALQSGILIMGGIGLWSTGDWKGSEKGKFSLITIIYIITRGMLEFLHLNSVGSIISDALKLIMDAINATATGLLDVVLFSKWGKCNHSIDKNNKVKKNCSKDVNALNRELCEGIAEGITRGMSDNMEKFIINSNRKIVTKLLKIDMDIETITDIVDCSESFVYDVAKEGNFAVKRR